MAWLIAIVLGMAGPAVAADLYEGKTVRIVVGFSAGGGFDVYARTLARHLGRHLPGNPTVIVENMPGASSLLAANHVYARSKPDGLTIGFIHGNLLMQHLLGGEGIAFDPARFEWIGSPTTSTGVCVMRATSGITSVARWRQAPEPVKLGAIAPGDTTHDIPSVLAAALRLPMRLVAGHKGTPEIRLAAERGDVAGLCVVWETVKVMWSKALESGEAVPVLQVAPRRHPDLPNVPLAMDLAEAEPDRDLIRVAIHNPARIIRLFAAPPGTPAEKVQALRRAFLTVLRDPEFLADAQRARLEVHPLSGEEVDKIVADYQRVSPDLKARLKGVLLPK